MSLIRRVPPRQDEYLPTQGELVVAYAFEIAPRAPVGFVATPLALRIVGDASIVAVGLELGWSRKEAPVRAGRLALTADELLRSPEGQAATLPCRVVVSRPRPLRARRVGRGARNGAGFGREGRVEKGGPE